MLSLATATLSFSADPTPAPEPPAPTPDAKCVKFCGQYDFLCGSMPSNPPFLKEDGACLAWCMTLPRVPLAFGGGEGYGNNLECRQNHLDLIPSQGTAGRAFHCYHASPDGDGICASVPVGGYESTFHAYTAAEFSDANTGCKVSTDGTVADCFGVEANPPLSTLPATVKFLFAWNATITKLTKAMLAGLPNLIALHLEYNGIAEIEEGALDGLPMLETLVLNNNPIAAFPAGFLHKTTALKEFQMNTVAGEGGFPNCLPVVNGPHCPLMDLPVDFFANTKDLVVWSSYITGIIDLPVGFFKGLTKLSILTFVVNGVVATPAGGGPGDVPGWTDAAVAKEGLFDGLVSLRQFDFFGNGLTKLPTLPAMPSLKRFTCWNCAITELPEGALAGAPNLEELWLHNLGGGTPPFKSGYDAPPADYFETNPKLKAITMDAALKSAPSMELLTAVAKNQPSAFFSWSLEIPACGKSPAAPGSCPAA